MKPPLYLQIWDSVQWSEEETQGLMRERGVDMGKRQTFENIVRYVKEQALKFPRVLYNSA
jgi:hypothetical protein